MASYDNCGVISAVAGADLSAALYKFGVWNASQQVVVASSAQGQVDGIIGEAVTSGQVTQLIKPDGGITKVMAGAAITAGAKVASDASGRAITYVEAVNNLCQGIAIDAAAAAGDIIRIQFSHYKTGGGT